MDILSVQEGLTALGAARRGSQCSALLLAATQRALQHAVINVVFHKREKRVYMATAQARREDPDRELVAPKL